MNGINNNSLIIGGLPQKLKQALRIQPRGRIRALSKSLRTELGGEDVVDRRAAVLVPLVRSGLDQSSANWKTEFDSWSVLFTLRSGSVGLHKNEVSFPGGMLELHDKGSAVKAALRETQEETGLDLEESSGLLTTELLGELGDAVSKTGIIVTPVLAAVDCEADEILRRVRPNPNEVREVFFLRLSQLLDPAMVEQREWDHAPPKHFPARTTVYRAGPYPIWGLTAFFCDRLVQLLREIPE